MTNLLYSAIPFFLILGLLVFVHEFGHYWAAKRAGMKVHAFAIGMGPAIPGLTFTERGLRKSLERFHLFSRKRPAPIGAGATALDDDDSDPGTTYSICMIPVGGYVRIAGMDPNEDPNEPGAFNTKPWLWRFGTLIAGCVMNFVLAALLFCILGAFIGIPRSTNNRVDEVVGDTPAKRAGMQPGDRIIGIAGTQTTDVKRLRSLIESRPGVRTEVSVLRDGRTLTLPLTPTSETDPDNKKVGRIGVLFTPVMERVGPIEALRLGVDQTWQMTTGMIHNLAMMVRGKVEGRLGGPVAIFQETGREAQRGMGELIAFAAMLSINLGIINLLPVPALDGGRLVFLLLEAVRGGRRVDPKKEAYVHFVGLVVLLLLMVIITYHDLFDKVR